MTRPATYDPIAELYEFEYRDFDEDLPLYQDLATRAGSPILDVGCGTGRVTFALAQAGFQVTGIDESEAMLRRAERNLATNKPIAARVTLSLKSASDYQSATSFRLAIMTVNTFGHFLTKQVQLRVLRNIHKHLAPGGMLVIDMTPLDPISLTHSEGHLRLQWEKRDAQTGNVVQKWVTYGTDHRLQLCYYTIMYDVIHPDGAVKRSTVQMPLRYTFRYEAELLLEMAGFEVERVFGSYQLDEYDIDSERMIFVAHALGNGNG